MNVHNQDSEQIHTVFNGVANSFIVVTPDGVLVIDPGMLNQAPRLVTRMRRLGIAPGDVRLILVTHGHVDHAASAAALRRLTGAPIAMHRADIPLVATRALQVPRGRNATMDRLGGLMRRFGRLVPSEPFQPDLCLEEGESLGKFGAAARILHTPGHTAGSISIAFDDGILFVGDAILNLVRVSFPLWWDDPEAARASACKILALQPRLCYSGHGRPFPRGALEQFVSEKCNGTTGKLPEETV